LPANRSLGSDRQASGPPFGSAADVCERKMLVHLETLFAGAPRDQLNLGIGKPMRGQPSEYLVPKKVWVYPLADPGELTVVGHGLLDPPGRIAGATLRFEQVAVVWMAGQARLQSQAKGFRKQNVAILRALALADEDFLRLKINVLHADAHELPDPNRRVKQQPEHDLVLEIT